MLCPQLDDTDLDSAIEKLNLLTRQSHIDPSAAVSVLHDLLDAQTRRGTLPSTTFKMVKYSMINQTTISTDSFFIQNFIQTGSNIINMTLSKPLSKVQL